MVFMNKMMLVFAQSDGLARMFVKIKGRGINLWINLIVNKPNRRDREVWPGT